ncbi:MAG: AhpC/TSA family protein [Burkholderiales bacterium]|nr:AhpC/TSA family protein [Burkholderiales bacterium]
MASEEYDVLEREVNAALTAEQRQVRDAIIAEFDGLARRLAPLPAGAAAPPFVLPSGDGRLVGLNQLLADGPALIHFYRGHWCNICRHELKTFARTQHRFDELGVRLAFISPDSVEDARRVGETFGLGLDMLSDTGGRVARDFGVEVRLNEANRALYDTTGVTLSACDAEPCWSLPTPSSFLVGPDRTILYSHQETSLRTRLDPVDMVIALKSLLPAA